MEKDWRGIYNTQLLGQVESGCAYSSSGLIAVYICGGNVDIRPQFSAAPSQCEQTKRPMTVGGQCTVQALVEVYIGGTVEDHLHVASVMIVIHSCTSKVMQYDEDRKGLMQKILFVLFDQRCMYDMVSDASPGPLPPRSPYPPESGPGRPR